MDLPGNMANMTISVNSSNVNASVQSNNTIGESNSTNEPIIENETNNGTTTHLEECLICSDLKRDTIFKVFPEQFQLKKK